MRLKNKLNRHFLLLTFMFSVFLLITSAIACFYAYDEKKARILSSMDMAYSYLDQEYHNIYSNFWQVYMPLFEGNSNAYHVLHNYFTSNNTKDLTPLEKLSLAETLREMSVRDNRIEWIALYSNNRSVNYIKYIAKSDISTLPSSFPYLSDLHSKTSQMEIYGAKEIVKAKGNIRTFAICGGVPAGMGNGKILIGYRLGTLDVASRFLLDSVPSMHFYILSSGQLLYDSFGEYLLDETYIPKNAQEGLFTFQGEKIYARSDFSGNNDSMIVSTASWKDIFLAAHKDTPWILAMTISFMVLSLFVHINMNRSVSKEVSVIQEGLNMIADNHLDYRLPTDFKQGGLPEIAQNINVMSSKLDENIKKAYYFELKQKDAQLARLQATFNPHFLYNTLEMLRSKSYASGDEDTAKLIADLATIFRSFIGAKTFVTLKEELTFNKKYLALLSARYGDRVTVNYDIDSSLLNFGIIRNVFQILIENYFVHGFVGDEDDNFIRFVGKSLDEKNMLISLEDNGSGMSNADIELLNRKIEEPIRHGTDSYGLKNLNQRLKLFYGPDCGLFILKNNYGGLTVQMKLRKMRVEEYEELG